MPDYPPGYDPTFDFEMPPSGYVIMGLVALSALATGVSVGAFYTYSAAAAAPAVPLAVRTFSVIATGPAGPTATTVKIVENVVLMNQAQVQALGILQTGAITLSPGAIAVVLDTWGIETLSLEALALLAAYNRALPQGIFGRLGNWLGGNLHGGSQEPPGFPGFIGSYPGQGSTGGYYGCVEVDGVQECYWHY